MNDLGPAWNMLVARAEMLKAIAHPARLCILKGLLESEGCNVTRMQHCTGLPQSTISQHLGKLRGAGVVIAERRGVQMHYRIADTIRKMVENLLADVPSITRTEVER